MKRALVLLILAAVLLCSCTKGNDEMEKVLSLRERMQNENSSFDVEITADYGDKIYSFRMHCKADPAGALWFSVEEPQSISGISGYITNEDARIVFDETELAFPVLADGQFTPVSAPWVLIRSLRGGYINSTCTEGAFTRVSVDDSYAEDALHMDVWLDSINAPVRGEILWDNRRILTMDVTSFRFE